MAIAHLVTQKVQEVHFANRLDQSGQVALKTAFNFSVKYNQDNSRCVARIYQTVKDPEQEDKIFLSVELAGVFACEDIETDEDKKQVHTQCYDQLFPYLQTTVNNLMNASGIHGFMLCKAQMDRDKVVLGRTRREEGDKPQFPIV